ncbi:MAG: hypothetical protein KGH98_03570 [Candidatus Micrarchaeota archaeon]|nr:hypothetical protein [Candidatus Micrarchaeota archaeon]
MAELWTNYTDSLITDMDRQMKAKYKLSLRDLFTDPARFAQQDGIENTLANITEEVNNYMGRLLDSVADRKRQLDADLGKADSISKQLAQNISMQAKQNKVPVVRPAIVDRDVNRDETLYIDYVDQDVFTLIERLTAASHVISDLTDSFEDHTIGQWLFSGDKNYVIRVYLRPNSALTILSSSRELNDLLQGASEFIKGMKSAGTKG